MTVGLILTARGAKPLSKRRVCTYGELSAKEGRQSGQEIEWLHVCKISPGIACIPSLDHRRKNENIKEWCGVVCLRNMRQVRENYP